MSTACEQKNLIDYTHKPVFVPDIVIEQKQKTGFKMADLPLEEKQSLVGAFAWLIQEDKKQNPELYQLKKTQKND